MRTAALAYSFFSFFILCARGQNVKEAFKNQFQAQNSFEHLCGRLEYQRTSSLASRKALSRVHIELFKSTEEGQCCSASSLVEGVTTNSKGTFRFKHPSPGRYFVVARYRGTPSTLEVVVKEGKDATPCWQQELVIDHEGKMQLDRTISFDYGHD